jgi:Tfp pilus assembly protein PilZ
MGENEIEKRTCIRFKIPGATVNYQRKSLLPRPGFMEEFCPVLDISRGGIRFLTQKVLKPDTEVTLRISVPGERIPFSMKGVVKWSSPSEGKSYQFQVGVQFNPYGMDKDQNLPQAMVKIMALEQKFADKAKPGEEPSGPDEDEFQI